MLKLSKKEAVLVSALCEIATVNRYISSYELAKKLSIHGRYIERGLQKLTQSKVINSRKGLNGGYMLARPSGKLSLLDVCRASRKSRSTNFNNMATRLGIIDLVRDLDTKIENVYSQISLQEIIRVREKAIARNKKIL